MESANTNITSIQKNQATIEQYVVEFQSFARKTAESIICMAEVVFKAKQELRKLDSKGDKAHEHFSRFCEAIGYNKKTSTIRKLEQIGEMAGMLKSHADKLPNTWTTLYTLSQLGGNVLEQMIDQGHVAASITAKEATALLAAQRGQTSKTDKQAKVKISQNANQDVERVEDDGFSFTVHFDATPSAEMAASLIDNLSSLMKVMPNKPRLAYSKSFESLLNALNEQALANAS